MKKLKSKLLSPNSIRIKGGLVARPLLLISHLLFYAFTLLANSRNYVCLLPPILLSLGLTVFLCFRPEISRKSHQGLRAGCLSLLNSLLIHSIFAISFIFTGISNDVPLRPFQTFRVANFSILYLFLSFVNIFRLFKIRFVYTNSLISISNCLFSFLFDLLYRSPKADTAELLENLIPLAFLVVVCLMQLLKKRKRSISKRILLKMLEDSPSGKLIIKNGEILLSNPAFLKIFGMSNGVTLDDLRRQRFKNYIKLNGREGREASSGRSRQLNAFSSNQSSFIPGKYSDFNEVLAQLNKYPEVLHTFYTQGEVSTGIKNTEADGLHLKSLSNEIDFIIDSKYSRDGQEPDKEKREIEMKIGYIDWEHFQEEYIMILFNDVTDAQEIKNNEEDFEYKINILNSFSHELQTPLNITKSMADALMDDKVVPPWIKEKYCQFLQASVKLQHFLVQDIIDFLKIQTGQLKLSLEIFSLSDAIKEAMSSLLTWSREGKTELVFDDQSTTTSKIKVYFDRNRLIRMLINLFADCIKHSKNGLVSISANIFKEEFCTIQIKGSGGQASLSPSRNASQDCFSSQCTKWNEKDFRLVLTGMLAKQLSKYGLDEIASELREDGCTFWMTLPLAIEEASLENENAYIASSNVLDTYRLNCQSSKLIPATDGPNSSFKKTLNAPCPKVLIVDDDPFNLLSMETILKKLGIHSLRATNGCEAIDILTAFKATHACEDHFCKGIQCVFMDLMMPVMDGLEASLELNKLMQSKKINEVPIVACTANDSTIFEDKAKEAGMKAFLNKPISLKTVQGILKEFNVVKQGEASSPRFSV